MTLSGEIEQLQEQPRRSFAVSALPLTMELARLARPELLRAIPESSAPFCFEDRVFVLLVPDMLHDLVMFYAGRGEALASNLTSAQLRRLDGDLLRQLFEVLQTIAPDLAAAVIAKADQEKSTRKEKRKISRKPILNRRSSSPNTAAPADRKAPLPGR